MRRRPGSRLRLDAQVPAPREPRPGVADPTAGAHCRPGLAGAAASTSLRRQYDHPELLAVALERPGGFRVRDRAGAGLGASRHRSFVSAGVAEAAEERFAVVAEVAAVSAGGLVATLLRTVDAAGFRERTRSPALAHSPNGAGWSSGCERTTRAAGAAAPEPRANRHRRPPTGGDSACGIPGLTATSGPAMAGGPRLRPRVPRPPAPTAREPRIPSAGHSQVLGAGRVCHRVRVLPRRSPFRAAAMMDPSERTRSPVLVHSVRTAGLYVARNRYERGREA
jgi:hypothetical protein